MSAIPHRPCGASLLGGSGLRQPVGSLGMRGSGPVLSSCPLGCLPDWSGPSCPVPIGTASLSPAPLPDGDPLWRRSGLSKDCCGASIH